MLPYALLGFLSYMPLSGYDLKQSIDNSTRYFWNAKQSQIYRTLKQLEVDGLITSQVEPQEDRPDRRVYSITPQGRDHLLAWLAEPQLEPHYLRHPLLLKVFFSAYSDKDALLTELKLQRSLAQRDYEQLSGGIQQHLQEQQAHTPDSPLMHNTFLQWENVRRFGELYFEMMASWLDETIQHVEEEFIEENKEK
jgi:PadR family transcriptional regulator, regulatory protein AphA